jgi:hypothetical protein
MISEKLIQPVNITELPNYDHLDAQWKKSTWDTGNVYSIPHFRLAWRVPSDTRSSARSQVPRRILEGLSRHPFSSASGSILGHS